MISDQVFEEGWAKTVGGKLFTLIESSGHSAAVIGKGTNHEQFLVDGATVHLYRKEVGTGQAIQLQYAVESFEYKQVDWWKNAIDQIGDEKIELLDPKLVDVVSDVVFRPTQVLSKYLPNIQKDANSIEQARKKIQEVMISTLSPLVAPHFGVEEQLGALRLVGKTPEAVASRKEDNAVYLEAVKKVAEAVPELEARYQSLV